jgi:transglutaminase-like putative cysteine protease
MQGGTATIRRPIDRTGDPAGDTAAPNAYLPFHPAFGRDVRMRIEPRPAGDDDEPATAQTIGRMCQYIRTDARNPIIRELALEATRGAHTSRERCNAVHSWIRAHVRYVEDKALAFFMDVPEDAEVLVRPVDLVRMADPCGDCDDFSMLTAAMLRAVGVPAKLKTIEADDEAPGMYSHIYVIAETPEPVAVDSSHGPRVGWEAQATGKTRLWPIDQEQNMTRTLGFTDVFGTDNEIPDIAGSDTSPWWGLANGGLNIAGSILGTRYSVPQLNPGQSIRTAAGTFTQAAPGQSLNLGSGGSGSMLLILAVVVILVIAMSRGGK